MSQSLLNQVLSSYFGFVPNCTETQSLNPF